MLQAAFDWSDSHLHRFSAGGGAYDRDARQFATALDVEHHADDGNTPEADVRLDEVLGEPGDQLTHTYDSGDDWAHVLRLEAVVPRDDATPRVVVTGRTVDLDAVREAVAAALDPGAAPPLPPPLAELRDRAAGPGAGAVARLLRGAGFLGWPGSEADDGDGGDDADDADDAAMDATAVTSAVLPWRRLLELVGADGVPLSAAGYLPPDVVVALREVVDPDHDWIGKGNREDLTPPVAEFRTSAQGLGLVRRYRGRLVPTPTGRRVARDADALLDHLLERLPLGGVRHERDAGLLVLLALAGGLSPDEADDLLGAGMDALGWSVGSEPVRGHDLRAAAHPTTEALRLLGALVRDPRPGAFGRLDVGRHGPVLARWALRQWPPLDR